MAILSKKDVTDFPRVRVFVYDVVTADPKTGRPVDVTHDESRSMLIPKADYKANKDFLGDILEEIPAGEEPKPWDSRKPKG